MTTWFVTGATGVVGSELVPRLAALPGARLRLLVRARDDAEATDFKYLLQPNLLLR